MGWQEKGAMDRLSGILVASYQEREDKAVCSTQHISQEELCLEGIVFYIARFEPSKIKNPSKFISLSTPTMIRQVSM